MRPLLFLSRKCNQATQHCQEWASPNLGLGLASETAIAAHSRPRWMNRKSFNLQRRAELSGRCPVDICIVLMSGATVELESTAAYAVAGQAILQLYFSLPENRWVQESSQQMLSQPVGKSPCGERPGMKSELKTMRRYWSQHQQEQA